MFSIFKKKELQYSGGYFPIVADMHSHILPGIDDGSPDVETSVQLIRGLMKLGVNTAVATPHIIGDIYRNDSDTIDTALSAIRKALEERQIDFKIKAAAEYMMDAYFLELIKNKTPLLAVKDNMVLTEFSYAERPMNTEHMVFTMITEGYQPILAHPERYAYYHDDYKEYHRLKDLGFLLQVNLLSLTGYYGRPAAKAAAYLIKNELISFAGTDLHHERHLNALQLPANHELFSKAFAGKMLNEEIAF